MYDKLFEPIKITSNLTFKNRLVMPAHDVNVGLRSKKAVAYYTERAKGGVGAIITGMSLVEAWASEEAWGGADKLAGFVEGCGAMAASARNAGAKVGIQMAFPNRFPAGRSSADTKGEPVAPTHRFDPSPKYILLQETDKELREITNKEIWQLINLCRKASENAKKAGFDFLELHLAHGYLGAQFFSPLFNQRNDEFGGDLERRMRFGLECVKAMRETVGKDFPIIVRLGAEEAAKGGVTPADGVEFAIRLEAAGVDVLHVSTNDRRPAQIPNEHLPEGTFVHLAEAVKSKVKIPVIAVGNFHTPSVMESVLNKGYADMVAMVRQLIADPLWPEKVKSGKMNEVVPCLRCARCIESVDTGSELQCSVNALAGKESTTQIKSAEKKKKLVVIGGGPGGMEAARVSAIRGHEVTLIEKAPRLGGSLLLLGAMETAVQPLIGYYERKLRNLGVNIQLGKEANKAMIDAIKPEAIVLAAGGINNTPEISGLDQSNVISSTDMKEALSGRFGNRKLGLRWIFWYAGGIGLSSFLNPLVRSWVQKFGIPFLGKNPIVIGDGLAGYQIGAFLAERGKKVTILGNLNQPLPVIPQHIRERLELTLKQNGAIIEKNITLEKVIKEGIEVNRDGQSEIIKGDIVIIATGMKPNSEMVRKLQSEGQVIFQVGDCIKPQRIGDAVAEAFRVANEF